jgi:hypothetical protein
MDLLIKIKSKLKRQYGMPGEKVPGNNCFD